MDTTALTVEEFLKAAKEFVEISDRIRDGWRLFEDTKDVHKSYIQKESFITQGVLLRAEFVIFYKLTYGVPSFSFNMWNSAGMLLTLDEIRAMSFVKVEQKEFYSIITQQEHPIFGRPYFIVHPCQTESLLSTFRGKTKNIIVTFLSLITPLLRLNLPLEYGL